MIVTVSLNDLSSSTDEDDEFEWDPWDENAADWCLEHSYDVSL